jgi:hypothetical protein
VRKSLYGRTRFGVEVGGAAGFGARRVLGLSVAVCVLAIVMRLAAEGREEICIYRGRMLGELVLIKERLSEVNKSGLRCNCEAHALTRDHMGLAAVVMAATWSRHLHSPSHSRSHLHSTASTATCNPPRISPRLRFYSHVLPRLLRARM